MNTKEIDAVARPFTYDEAKSKIGKYIMKRPVVFGDDEGRVYKLVDVQSDGFTFWEKDHYWKSYKFENIIYDYIFENGTFIGIDK